MRHVDVGLVAKQQDLYDGFDDQYQCPILDEDKVIDELEEVMSEGGNVVDYHGCDFFPERWFHVVVVLRTDNTLLYDRLSKRGYSGQKLTDNVQCEIFQTILEEARDSYSHSMVHELPSNTPENFEQNVDIICTLISEWTSAHVK
ncbi:Adenylate kinase isoenzyme 6 [Geodia barretti]|uniref:Adenylate kinase isoenzyme 6 n=1 Tax=Geodia barretti TaxID=519541 RepID=A0AA35R6E8_GEOBA|nr:Adenylate kinase isoenzyme 6 [Geodia barretti]